MSNIILTVKYSDPFLFFIYHLKILKSYQGKTIKERLIVYSCENWLHTMSRLRFTFLKKLCMENPM